MLCTTGGTILLHVCEEVGPVKMSQLHCSIHSHRCKHSNCATVAAAGAALHVAAAAAVDIDVAVAAFAALLTGMT